MGNTVSVEIPVGSDPIDLVERLLLENGDYLAQNVGTQVLYFAEVDTPLPDPFNMPKGHPREVHAWFGMSVTGKNAFFVRGPGLVEVSVTPSA